MALAVERTYDDLGYNTDFDMESIDPLSKFFHTLFNIQNA